MAITLCAVFMSLSFFYMSTHNGFMSGIFLLLSLIAFMNFSGGNGSGPSRYA